MLKTLLKLLSPKTRIIRVKYRRKGGLGGADAHYKAHKEFARTLVHQKLTSFNLHYKFTYNKVAIRNQRSRWGSCSKRGNLNFHYRIVLLPEHLQDYLIVHELCHLEMFNHSKNFWALVAETIPDHAARRKELIAHGRKQHSTP